MKNSWKSRHPLFRVHRVHGIQNDRLDLTINPLNGDVSDSQLNARGGQNDHALKYI